MRLRRHKTLNKKIWASEQLLQPEVSDMLLSICWSFIDFVRNKHSMEIRNSDIKDIILFGSMTNYFYHSHSDLDICVVVDTKNLSEMYPNLNILHSLKLYYYDWAMIHICNIYGRKIDLNFEDVNNNKFDGRYRTGSNYSVLTSKWIFKSQPVSNDDFKKMKQSGKELFDQIMQDYKRVKKNGFQMQEMENLYGSIMASKRAVYDINCQQVITPMYIAFNKLKKRGIVDKLRKKVVQIESKKFTLK